MPSAPKHWPASAASDRRIAQSRREGCRFLLDPQDFHHMFKAERFKVKPVGGVIIGADRFRGLQLIMIVS